MGIDITSVESDAFPRRTVIKLACDTEGCRSVAELVGHYIEARAAFTAAGWRERKASRRLFVCPTCNGIVPTPDLFR